MDKKEAMDVITSSNLSGQADLLIEHLLPSARLVVHEGGPGSVEDSVASYLGGLPSLPGHAAWPTWDRHDFLSGQIARLEAKFKANPRATGLRDIALSMRQDLASGPLPLPFLGQVSLQELDAAAPLPGWPRDGLLLFFCETSAWGFDPLARGHCRVVFIRGHQEIAPRAFPKDLPDGARFTQCRVSFERQWTLPTVITLNGADLSIWDNDDYGDLCQCLMSGLNEDEPIHRCGGHPQEIQGDMRLECQLVTNGIYCGDPSGYQDLRVPLLEKGAADWQLLLQVDSDEKRLGWMWGDAGRVYFWARRQDIESTDFDSSWAILQCY